jgi:triosephosphate isomerase (TIM)
MIMRKKIVAGNWKMNMEIGSARELARGVCNDLHNREDLMLGDEREVIFFPPYLFLPDVVEICREYNGIHAGAQNCHQEEKGAYTGEIAASMIQSVGASHTLIGHSERRSYFGEDDQLLAKKTKIALENDLTPVFCCGELLPEREANNHFAVVKAQLVNGLFWLDKAAFSKVVIAYEPVWAIGTGVTATPEQAQEMHAYIRGLIKEHYGNDIGDGISILYGGSCNAKNAEELFSKPDVDGGLIGGASLKVQDFLQIIYAM